MTRKVTPHTKELAEELIGYLDCPEKLADLPIRQMTRMSDAFFDCDYDEDMRKRICDMVCNEIDRRHSSWK